MKPPQIVNRRVKGSFGVFLFLPRISLFLTPIAAGFALLRSFLNNGQMVDRTAIIEKDIAILRIRCPSAERGRASLPRPPARPSSVSLPFPPSLSRRCRSRTKCLIEFQTRQLHRSVIGLADAADTVLKETDKNSESFTVHRSPAQARFDPTPAAASARRQRLRILMPRESERPENEISVPADQRARYGEDPNCRGIQTKEERNPKLRYVSAIALIPESSGN